MEQVLWCKGSRWRVEGKAAMLVINEQDRSLILKAVFKSALMLVADGIPVAMADWN